MKRPIEALAVTEIVAVLAAAAIAGLCGGARAAPPPAVAPVVRLSGDARLTGADAAAAPVFHVDAAFGTSPPGARPFTIQQAVVWFADHAGTNGRLFPSCSARQIERFHGNVARCPKGSRIGSGTVRATAIQIDVTARGRVALFNGPGGRSVTFNIQTNLPAYINESIDAPITQLHGRYGEKLTLVVPHSLQEILSGVYVGVRDFDVTLGGAVRVRGVEVPYLKARACPKIPMHGVFDFKDWTSGQTAQVGADARVRCRRR